jgi:hypothetical protein
MAHVGGYRIVFIHGLASKPSQDVLHELWRRTLIANVRCDSPTLADAMEAAADLFHTAYWASAIPDHIEDAPTEVSKLGKAITALIAERQGTGRALHIGSAGWIDDKIKRFGLSIVDALASAITIKDDVIREHLREVRLYSADQYVADRIREPLEEALRTAWDASKRVVVIAHSMGTFVSYDVFWRFSHRAEPHYRRYRKACVDLFITMGSPLGDPTLRSFMLTDRWKEAVRSQDKTERVRYYPTNVARWLNFSAFGDIVCHDATLEDDFFTDMREHVGGYEGGALRDYVKLYNPYRNSQGHPNPHKSYGYLIQPKLSQRLIEFFGV